MKGLLVATALISLSTSAIAGEWTYTKKLGYEYLMPPMECREGPFGDVLLNFVGPDDMQNLFGQYAVDGRRIYGAHQFDDQGRSYIYIDETLPDPVSTDIIEHELAHARGCTPHE